MSPVGCLMFSYKSMLQNSEYVGLMQYLEALVMCDALQEMNEASKIDINIKWPNDVYVNKKTKICGIMCQSIRMEYLISHLGLALTLVIASQQPVLSMK